MAQMKLSEEKETLKDCEIAEIRKEETAKRFIKKAKRARTLSDLGQIRLGDEKRIHKRTLEFHEEKGARKKASKRKAQKVASEKARRIEQVKFEI